jgi:hypothetical protein
VPLDVEETLAALRIRQGAAENGGRNLPRATDTTLDGPQREIIQFVEKHIATTLARVGPYLRDLDRRIVQILHADPARELEETARRAEAEIDGLRREHEQRLARERAGVERLRAELAAFRRRAGLTREPHYPLSRVKVYGVLAVLIVLEAGLNAYFFAIGHDLGILGGVVSAIVLALVDLLVCFELGRQATNLNHASTPRRVLGALALALAVAWVLAYNLAAGHLREALARSGDLAEAMEAALASLRAAPLGLRQLDSWVLVGLGGLLSVGGIARAWSADDPYPGYGPLHRRLRDAEEDEEETRDELRRGIDALVEQASRQLQSALRQHESDGHALQAYATQGRALRENVDTFVAQMTGSVNALLRHYRDANLRARSDGAVPAYFDQDYTPQLPPGFSLPEPPAADAGARMLERLDLVREREAALRAQLAERAAAARKGL